MRAQPLQRTLALVHASTVHNRRLVTAITSCLKSLARFKGCGDVLAYALGRWPGECSRALEEALAIGFVLIYLAEVQ